LRKTLEETPDVEIAGEMDWSFDGEGQMPERLPSV